MGVFLHSWWRVGDYPHRNLTMDNCQTCKLKRLLIIRPLSPLVSRLTSIVNYKGALATAIGNTMSARVAWQGGRDNARGNRTPHRTEDDLAVLIAPRQSRDCLRGKVLATSPLRCGRSVRRWPRALPHSHFVSSLPRGRVFAPVRFRSCPPPGEGNSRRIALSRYALLALLASCLSPTSSCARNAYSAQTCPSSLPRRNFLLA